MKRHLALIALLILTIPTFAQKYTRQDTLRGSNGNGRNWWDVTAYDLKITIDTGSKSISGINLISFVDTSAPIDSIQLDLQGSMVIDSVEVVRKDHDDGVFEPALKNIPHEGNIWWVKYPFSKKRVGGGGLSVIFHGKPPIAKNPPWDGGFIWTHDSTGNPWIAVACQGLGASSWWPCKDYQGDEPRFPTRLCFDVPKGLTCVSNGRFLGTGVSSLWRNGKPMQDSSYRFWAYDIYAPINTYDITFYIGDYVSWTDTIMGEKGVLDLSFYALREHEQKAREHFKVAKQMLHCFEYWMGPYPFYEDGYKLVEAPYLGMEHQSAVAYGNEYKMGYRGTDRSGTGVGLLFDFIIVHESGHEWFGNSITAQDIADNWLHEGFTTYTEALFVECAYGREKAFEYTRGEWHNIRNDRPVIGDYGVNDEGSGDKYDKGSAVVHMIRMIMNDDEKFRQLLRSLNMTFYHKIVTSAEVESYISQFAGYDFKPLFDQYLRTAKVPQLEYYIKNGELYYRFTNIVPDFALPLEAKSGIHSVLIRPTAEWQHVKWKGGYDIAFSDDFYFKVKN